MINTGKVSIKIVYVPHDQQYWLYMRRLMITYPCGWESYLPYPLFSVGDAIDYAMTHTHCVEE